MNLIDRAKKMILSPKTEWDVIASELPEPNLILKSYVIPLTLLGAAAAFIGYGLIGFGSFGLKVKGLDWGLYYALNKIIIGISSIFITAYVVDALAPSFASEKNFGRSFQLVAYGSTPSLLAGVLGVLPMLSSFVSLAGAIYGVYLWYIGLTPLKKTPEEKKVLFLVIIFLVLIFVYGILGLILSTILMPALGLSLGSGMFG